MKSRLLALSVTLALLGAACSGSSISRATVLAELATAEIIPAYQQLAVEADSLAAHTAALCADVTPSTLADAQSAMLRTRGAWKKTEAMWVGPVMKRRSWAVVDWPIAIDEIELLIGDDSIELDQDRLSRRIGADQRGLGAIEYVLFGDDTLVALGHDRRCAYVAEVAAVIQTEVALLVMDWTESFEDGPPYRHIFAADDDSSGLDALVNDQLFLLEKLADAELGVALGARQGPADPAALVEGRAGAGHLDLELRLAGIRAALGGLAALLPPEMARRISLALDAADASLAVITAQPLAVTLVENTADLTTFRNDLKELQVLVATEVVSWLGVAIGFSDADGDSAG